MKPESMVNTFRDMSKNPDMHPADLTERAETKKMLDEDRSKGKIYSDYDDENADLSLKKEKKEKMLDPISKSFEDTINLVSGAGLLPEFKDNQKEQEILEQRKKLILNYLKRVLEDTKNYLSQVNNWQIQNHSSNEADLKKFQDLMGTVDEERKASHNRLISDISVASRLINVNFNVDYPEELRLQEESRVLDRKGLSLGELKEVMSQRQYYKFPVAHGAFIDLSKANKDPLTERKMIASWAFKIYTDLTMLDEDLESMKKAQV